MKTTSDPAISKQYLTFLIKGEVFGINILQVSEIVEFREILKIPTTPDFIRGILNLRGRPTVVIDLTARFFGAPGELLKTTCIVIVEGFKRSEHALYGILVDNVIDVVSLDPSHIEPPPDLGSRIHIDFIEGVTVLDSSLVILLKAQKILDLDQLWLQNLIVENNEGAQKEEEFLLPGMNSV